MYVTCHAGERRGDGDSGGVNVPRGIPAANKSIVNLIIEAKHWQYRQIK